MDAIAHTLPIAVGVAFSTVPIMLAIVILLSPQRSRSAIPFLIGWVVGILVMVSVCALVAHAVPTADSPREPDTAVGLAEIIVGVALIGLAVFTWVRRGRPRRAPKPAGGGMTAKIGPWSALGLGFVLNLRPKGLLLAVAAGLAIRADAGSVPLAAIAIAVFTVVAASTVAIPIIGVTVAPERMEPPLIRVRDWLSTNGAVITSVVLVLVGVAVIAIGLERL